MNRATPAVKKPSSSHAVIRAELPASPTLGYQMDAPLLVEEEEIKSEVTETPERQKLAPKKETVATKKIPDATENAGTKKHYGSFVDVDLSNPGSSPDPNKRSKCVIC